MKKRRILAMVLSAALAVTAVPVSVFGEEADALISEDEVLVEEAAPVEEAAEAVEAAPEEAPVEEAAPVDELIIEDQDVIAENPEISESTVDDEFIIVDDDFGQEEQTDVTSNDYDWTGFELKVKWPNGSTSQYFDENNFEKYNGLFEASDSVPDITYDPYHDGTKLGPSVDTLKIGSDTLSVPDDYTYDWANATGAGLKSDAAPPCLVITFNKNNEKYKNIPNIRVKYDILPYSLADHESEVSVDMPKGISFTYNGLPQHPKADELTVVLTNPTYDGEKTVTLVANDEYIVEDRPASAFDNDYYVNAGPNKSVIITGVGNFTDSCMKSDATFEIKKKTLTSDEIDDYIVVPEPKTFYVHGTEGVKDSSGRFTNHLADSTYPSNGIREGYVWAGVKDGTTGLVLQNYDAQFFKGSHKIDPVELNSADEKDVGDYTYRVYPLGSGTWDDNFVLPNGVTDLYAEGSFSIRLHPPLTEVKGLLQDMIDYTAKLDTLEVADFDPDMPDFYLVSNRTYKDFFSYYGDNKIEGLEVLILRWLDTYWGDGDGVELDTKELVNAGDYTVSLKGVNSSSRSAWGTGSADLDVHIEPRELVDSDHLVSGITVELGQWEHSNGKFENQTPFVSVEDNGLNVSPLPHPLAEEDYVLSPKYNDDGKVTELGITGRRNYKSTLTTGKNGTLALKDGVTGFTRKDSTIPLNSVLIRAELKEEAKSKLHYHDDDDILGGDPIELTSADFTLEEVMLNGDVVRVFTDKEFRVTGYDDHIDNAGFIPSNAGDHVAYLSLVKGIDKYTMYHSEDKKHVDPVTGKTIWTGKAPVTYKIEGEHFYDEYQTVKPIETAIEKQPIFTELDAEEAELLPVILNKETNEDSTEHKDRFDYFYWFDSDDDGQMSESEKAVGIPLDGDVVSVSAKRKIQFNKRGQWYLNISPNRGSKWNGGERVDDDPIVVPFEVGPRNLTPDENVLVSLSNKKIEWPGRNVTVDDFKKYLQVKDIGANVKDVLTPEEDYDVILDPDPMTEIGKGHVIVKGKNDYEGEKSIEVEVLPRDISSGKLTLKRRDLPYAEGKAYKISSDYVQVDLTNPTDTVPGSSLSATFVNGGTLNVGSKSQVLVTASGNYIGTLTSDDNVNIVKGDISVAKDFEVRGLEDAVYDGTSKLDQSAAQLWNLQADEAVPSTNYEIVVSDDDYVNVGTHTVTLRAKGDNYTGEATGSFEITKAENNLPDTLAAITVKVGDTAQLTIPANVQGTIGYSCTPANLVSIIDGKVTGVTAGTGTIMITASGNDNYLSDTCTVEVTVVAVAESLEGFTATVEGGPFVYNKQPHTPKITVTKGTVSLTEGTDYDVTYADHTTAGTATYTVTGKNNYSGSITGTFTIEKAKNSIKLKAKYAKKYYDTKAVTTTKLAGATAESGAVTYSINNSNLTINASTGAITIPAQTMGRATVTVKSVANPNYEDAVATCELVIQPKKVKLISAHNNKGKVKLTWEKSPDRSGYVVKYSKDSTFKTGAKYVWIKKEEATSARFIQKMKKGETYYFKVKVYKNIPGQKKVTSEYSNTKKLTIK